MKTFTKCLMVFGILFAVSTAHAASKEELEKKLEKRYPKLLDLKRVGTIGETWEGYVDVREGDDEKVKQLIDEENADRKAVYQIIAKETDTSLKTVAERAGKRNFDKAKNAEYLKGKDGKWSKKA